jgi:hypothetical protein
MRLVIVPNTNVDTDEPQGIGALVTLGKLLDEMAKRYATSA